ncbi:MAG: ABC transporter ATP-binding protein [Acidobacteria bacterium]|nr:MAG: ABC transporter ATP-binding protein [Acidobacteriota bacterium]
MSTNAVEVHDLAKAYGKLRAVDGITFEVDAGEMFGFLGPNGAGKTTTISMLCTLVKPTSGSAIVAGRDVVSERERVRKNIGLVFQDPTLDELLTAEQNLRFHGVLYGLGRAHLKDRMTKVLKMVELESRRGDLVRTFSGGMRRRLEIARGLMHSPRVLFLDEPTVGLDPQTRLHIWDYIDELSRTEDITIFLTTHYLEEAERCSRIAIIDAGKIVAIDTPAALKASVGEDCVTLQTEDDPESWRQIKERLGVEAALEGDRLTCMVPDGEAFIPRLIEALDIGVRSISTRKPTLDDVFVKYTGRAIRDADADSTQINRDNPWIRSTTRRSA